MSCAFFKAAQSHDPASAKVKTQTTTGAEVSSEVVISAFAAMKDISGGEEVDGKVRHLVSRTYTIWFNPLVKEKEPL
jgi:hypothetical protein